MGDRFLYDKDLQDRKLEHINIVLNENITHSISNWLEYVFLIHNSLPEISLNRVKLEKSFLGRVFSYPILIDSMTGGAKGTEKINEALALLAEKYNIPVSCGSQKAALKDPSMKYTYKIMREVSNKIFLIGNIGAQDLKEDPKNISQEVVEMIEADALAIHLNPLQEAIQGNDVDYTDVIESIKKVTEYLDVPVIVKETGAGISLGVAKILESIGVSAINVSGIGGTSWSAVEAKRKLMHGNKLMAEVGELFRNWGIPTAASILEVVNAVNIPVIASGGIRNGIEIVKSLVLGASFIGMAAPFIKALKNGFEGLESFINKLIIEIRIAMFLLGIDNIDKLHSVGYVLIGPLREWYLQRLGSHGL